MKPLHARVWRKGNRRASRGFPRPRQATYWPICGSPSPQFLESRETPEGRTEYVWVCQSCGAILTSPNWVPLASIKERRHHQADVPR